MMPAEIYAWALFSVAMLICVILRWQIIRLETQCDALWRAIKNDRAIAERLRKGGDHDAG